MPEENQNVLLETKKLSKSFGGIRALSNFDMKVKKGEIHCLIGPNGAGKSTVFKLIMGLYPPTYGKVFFKGEDITGLKAHKIADKGISIKMQVPGVYSELTMRENIRIAAQRFVQKKELDDEIEKLIKRVKLDKIGNPYVKNMSHGQQQWLEIAMAISNKPDILFLDEPAAGLGTEETEFTAQLVEDLNRSGMTILFIEHDMNFVKRIAKNVTVLHQGKKFTEGTLDEILHNDAVADIYLGRQTSNGTGKESA